MGKRSKGSDELARAQARIRELEAQLNARRTPANPRQGDLAEAEAWLRQIITELFNHDDPNALYNALAGLGDFLRLDDCLMARVDGDILHWELIWQRQPSDDDRQIFHHFQLQHMPVAHQHMLQGKLGIDRHVAQQGYATPESRAMAERLNLQAYLTVPVLHHGKLHSFLALLQRHHPRNWSELDIHVAESFSALLSMALSRQETLRALSVSQQRFQDAMAATRDGIWEWDLHSDELYLSEGFYRMLGYQPGDFVPTRKALLQRLHPDDQQWFESFDTFVRSESANQAKLRSKEIRFQHKDGHTIWCFVRAKFTEYDEAGFPTRMVGVNSDISTFKTVQEELSIAKTLADSANQSKSEFLARMSHEIRTPMNAIIGMGHLLKDTRLSRQQSEYLANIDQAANSLLYLINEILDFSKIEAGTIILESNHFDLYECFNKLSERFAPLAELKGLELFFHLTPDTPQFLKGDSFRLQQALGNLIDNAIKFTDSGEIYVNVSTLTNCKDFVELQFEIRDSGIGMTPQQVSELFTPFMQIDGSSRRRFGGSGLGLSVSKHLIELMHGNIQLDSQPERGSKFTVTARFGQSQIGALPLRTRDARFRPLRTLVVDDNKAARQILANLANHLELQVNSVASAREAYAALKAAEQSSEGAFELVLMDYKMPEEDGLVASDKIKHQCGLQQVPAIILVSAFQKEEVQKHAAKNIEHFLTKPVSQSHLFDAIAEVFGAQAYSGEPPWLDDVQLTARLRNTHVLLAEDNIVNQKVALGILKKMHVQVTLANNGQEAIDALYRHPSHTFNCILMDMEMPQVDGYDATRRIRAGQHCQDIPIVALTAHAMRGDRKRCLDAGMDAYLTKPIKPELLYQTLANVIPTDTPHAQQ